MSLKNKVILSISALALATACSREPHIETVSLSNGLNATGYVRTYKENGNIVREIVTDTGYGSMKVYDRGGGNVTAESDGRTYASHELTYEFGKNSYPIWEPTAFRDDPYHGLPSYVNWDMKLTVLSPRDGHYDNLWSIAEETNNDPLEWKKIMNDNIERGVFGRNFNPRRDLKPGQKILVYMPLSAVEDYKRKHPEREIEYWSHAP